MGLDLSKSVIVLLPPLTVPEPHWRTWDSEHDIPLATEIGSGMDIWPNLNQWKFAASFWEGTLLSQEKVRGVDIPPARWTRKHVALIANSCILHHKGSQPEEEVDTVDGREEEWRQPESLITLLNLWINQSSVLTVIWTNMSLLFKPIWVRFHSGN